METFGSPVVRSKIHTISDFLDEWEERMYLLKFMRHPRRTPKPPPPHHPYLLLHNQIVNKIQRSPEK